MAKSALLKSSLAKKYWMALTGLFLCLFLIGHLIGNLQLLATGENAALNFNKYALFMTTNPAVKLLSYLTYFSILFHAVDGIVLTVQNKKARPVGYVKNSASSNTVWASRNMAVLGTLILVFIVTHMVNFWAVMHFDENMPLQKVEIEVGGMKQELYLTTDGGYMPVAQVEQGNVEIKHRKDFYDANAHVKLKEGYKDLYKVTVDFFKHEKWGLLATILYVFAMFVLAFHLYHGFSSAFQSLGLNNPKYNSLIKNFGKAFSVVVPLLFASIPVFIHFILK
ncbi:succinate dehydrogenase [Flavobacterium rakeshii]|uniref:Succinate dehydrogenase n=1 Tax=Flavobacterium rakeshii TaxID=1038845 RepID=A0A6N8HII1_9FLAO|nr:succinate dehydrogenase cytochrome b subunit [Flavobacterium rakeshii]MEE1899118.1 succinate dehydrogenase cytochrome b subunit [Flavobacterium rakeshii]MUV05468.1 succinate dehydrogenase [Flavobacterium rakeshii]